MTDRRRMLTRLAAGLAALPAAAFGASAQAPHAQHGAGADPPDCECERPNAGPYARYFPNVVVHTHEGRRALFYNDLLRGKTVLVNCMSVETESLYRVTENLLRVQRALGERAGRGVFIYSLTVDPARDTPRALAAFAERFGVQPGWLFLTGKPDALDLLRGRLFADASARGHAHGPAREDCSLGLLRYGNESVGLWGAVPARSPAGSIVARLSWVESRAGAAGGFKRRGPLAPAASSARRA